jgi:H+/Cl- antiporter ClcA
LLILDPNLFVFHLVSREKIAEKLYCRLIIFAFHYSPSIYTIDAQDSNPYWTAAVLTLCALALLACVCASFGSWIPGGIYVPALAIGACLGRAVGVVVAQVYSGHREAEKGNNSLQP